MSRFTFSTEQYAEERVAAVREAFKELISEYPEIISGVLFGSLTKGKARIDSDIDLYVFVDPDKLSDQDTTIYRRMNIVRRYEDNRSEYTMAWIGFTQNIMIKYADLLRNKIKEKLFGKLSIEQVRDIIVMPLNEFILNYELKELVDFYLAHPNQSDEIGELEVESISHLTDTHEIPYPQGASVRAADQLWYLFSYEIGGNISPYQKYTLQYLSEQGIPGELAWRNIMRNTEASEQKVDYKDLPTSTDYPRTLEQARNLFT